MFENAIVDVVGKDLLHEHVRERLVVDACRLDFPDQSLPNCIVVDLVLARRRRAESAKRKKKRKNGGYYNAQKAMVMAKRRPYAPSPYY
tara:strand:+ start:2438 stop:2704 length:267 start_codon:yes stop_codon:yes gene_type:complete